MKACGPYALLYLVNPKSIETDESKNETVLDSGIILKGTAATEIKKKKTPPAVYKVLDLGAEIVKEFKDINEEVNIDDHFVIFGSLAPVTDGYKDMNRYFLARKGNLALKLTEDEVKEFIA